MGRKLSSPFFQHHCVPENRWVSEICDVSHLMSDMVEDGGIGASAVIPLNK
jgi:hypothetical protein